MPLQLSSYFYLPIQIKNKNNMATHQITIAKASKNDFEKVYNLLSPMEELFNNRWSNEESWTEWGDDNEDKLELLAIRMGAPAHSRITSRTLPPVLPRCAARNTAWTTPRCRTRSILARLRGEPHPAVDRHPWNRMERQHWPRVGQYLLAAISSSTTSGVDATSKSLPEPDAVYGWDYPPLNSASPRRSRSRI